MRAQWAGLLGGVALSGCRWLVSDKGREEGSERCTAALSASFRGSPSGLSASRLSVRGATPRSALASTPPILPHTRGLNPSVVFYLPWMSMPTASRRTLSSYGREREAHSSQAQSSLSSLPATTHAMGMVRATFMRLDGALLEPERGARASRQTIAAAEACACPFTLERALFKAITSEIVARTTAHVRPITTRTHAFANLSTSGPIFGPFKAQTLTPSSLAGSRNQGLGRERDGQYRVHARRASYCRIDSRRTRTIPSKTPEVWRGWRSCVRAIKA
jgi:hypothetical protein